MIKAGAVMRRRLLWTDKRSEKGAAIRGTATVNEVKLSVRTCCKHTAGRAQHKRWLGLFRPWRRSLAATESASNACARAAILCCLSSDPACFATPIIVPVVSNSVTRRNEKTTHNAYSQQSIALRLDLQTNDAYQEAKAKLHQSMVKAQLVVSVWVKCDEAGFLLGSDHPKKFPPWQ
jgi:hypothetical protein